MDKDLQSFFASECPKSRPLVARKHSDGEVSRIRGYLKVVVNPHLEKEKRGKKKMNEHSSNQNIHLKKVVALVKPSSFRSDASNEKHFDKICEKKISLPDKSLQNERLECYSDQDYFSCEMTGSSSPVLVKRPLECRTMFKLERSFSFQNIQEIQCKRHSSLPKRKTKSSVNLLNLPYLKAKNCTITLDQCEDDREPDASDPVRTQTMDKAMEVLKTISENVRTRWTRERLMSEPKADLNVPLLETKKKKVLHKMTVTQKANLNRVVVTKDFKEMTKRLVDLADHIDRKDSVHSASPSSSIKRKRKLKIMKPRRVTWDENKQTMYFEDKDMVLQYEERDAQSLRKKSTAFFSSISGDDSKYGIKEEPKEYEEDDYLNLNLNLCETEPPSFEDYIMKAYSMKTNYSGSITKGSESCFYDSSRAISPPSKRKRKKKCRKLTTKEAESLPVNPQEIGMRKSPPKYRSSKNLIFLDSQSNSSPGSNTPTKSPQRSTRPPKKHTLRKHKSNNDRKGSTLVTEGNMQNIIDSLKELEEGI